MPSCWEDKAGQTIHYMVESLVYGAKCASVKSYLGELGIGSFQPFQDVFDIANNVIYKSQSVVLHLFAFTASLI